MYNIFPHKHRKFGPFDLGMILKIQIPCTRQAGQANIRSCTGRKKWGGVKRIQTGDNESMNRVSFSVNYEGNVSRI